MESATETAAAAERGVSILVRMKQKSCVQHLPTIAQVLRQHTYKHKRGVEEI